MSAKAVPQRVFRIRQRDDGRFESRNEHPTDSPLGVDYSMSQAIGTATREAILASRAGCRVVIKAQLPNGTWEENQRRQPATIVTGKWQIGLLAQHDPRQHLEKHIRQVVAHWRGTTQQLSPGSIDSEKESAFSRWC
jgi:hypothetical protein